MGSNDWHVAQDSHVPEDVARLLGTVPEWFGQPEANAVESRMMV